MVDALPAPLPCVYPACPNKNTPLSDSKTLRCGRCHYAHYCNRKCQQADWPSHKQHCAKIAAQENVTDDMRRLQLIQHRVHHDETWSAELLKQAREASLFSPIHKRKLKYPVRGVLLFDLGNAKLLQQRRQDHLSRLQTSGRDLPLELESMYAVFTRPDDKWFDTPYFEHVRKMVKTYNPETEYVLCILTSMLSKGHIGVHAEIIQQPQATSSSVSDVSAPTPVPTTDKSTRSDCSSIKQHVGEETWQKANEPMQKTHEDMTEEERQAQLKTINHLFDVVSDEISKQRGSIQESN